MRKGAGVAGEKITLTLARCVAARAQAERERDAAIRRVGELEREVEKLTAAQAEKDIWNVSEN